MKFSLAFDIYNKEKWIKSLLNSWISNLSGQNEYEIIVVFDDCRDRSYEIANNYLKNCSYEHLALFADNKYEIYCNNLALEKATGDYIIFIQDDNWIYDKNWDLLLQKTIGRIENIGVIGFLAGLELLPSMHWKRVEINRPHKGKYFFTKRDCELGIWQVDAINRPFCISIELLRQMGNLDKEFMPSCGDDLDLSIKLLQKDKTNIYIPFDLVNASPRTLPESIRTKIYAKARLLCRKRYESYLKTRENKQIKMLIPLKEIAEGLQL